MLKKFKNNLLETITSEGFDPESFRGHEEIKDDLPAFVIELVGTPLQFWIRNPKDSYLRFDCKSVGFNPSFQPNEYSPRDEFTNEFRDIYEEFIYWLRVDVKDYLEEKTIPDLWAMGEEEHQVFGESEFEGDELSQFSVGEKTPLRLAISTFRLRLLDVFHPEQKGLEEIDKRLEYLSEAVDRLNKLDWKSLLLSTIISIATALSLDTEKGRLLFEIAKQVFSGALRLLR